MLDNDGKIGHRALTASGYKQLKAELKRTYMDKGKQWVEAKKRAEAEGSEFTDARPVKPRYKAVDKSSSGATAQKLAKKCQSRYLAAKRAREAKESL